MDELEKMYGINEGELQAYAELLWAMEKDHSAIMADSIEALNRFGRDVRTIQQKVGKLIGDNPSLREHYNTINEGVREIYDDSLSLSNAGWSELLGVPITELERGRKLNSAKTDLEQRLKMETMHLGDFGEKLDMYLLERAMAGYQKGNLLEKQFKPNPEYEEFLEGSSTARDLAACYVQLIPHMERMKKDMFNNPDKEED